MAEQRAGMRIKDRAEFRTKPKPLTFRPDATVFEAVEAMCEKNYGSVMVTDADERLVGVLTERDLMRKVVHGGLDARTTRISEVMTHDPRVASEDDDIVDWLRIMSNERFRRLPVVDSEGRVRMVFSQGDFVSYTWPDLMGQARNLARASLTRNFHYVLIVGGVMLYTLLMILVIRTVL